MRSKSQVHEEKNKDKSYNTFPQAKGSLLGSEHLNHWLRLQLPQEN